MSSNANSLESDKSCAEALICLKVVSHFNSGCQGDPDESEMNIAIDLDSNRSEKQWNILQRTMAGDISQLLLESDRLNHIENLLKSEDFSFKVLTSSSQTLLHLLCHRPLKDSQFYMKEYYKIATLLIKNGVDVNYQDASGKTALMLACENGRTSIVQALTNFNGMELDIDAFDSSGETALIKAARKKNADAFNLLTSTSFLQSVKKEDAELVRKFHGSSRIECCRRFELSCLKQIPRKFPINIFAFHVERPPGSCISFYDWLEGISIADYCNSGFMNELLFKFENIIHGADVTGCTALHMAVHQYQCLCEFSGYSKIKILLKSGNFNVNTLTNYLDTVPHLACRPIHPECDGNNYSKLKKIIREFLCRKVNVNQRNVFGQTALMKACKNGNVIAVHELLKWKYDDGETIDINAKDNVGQTALSLAYQSNNAEIAAMIEQALLQNAIENDDLETIENVFMKECHEIGDDIQRSCAKEMSMTYEIGRSIPDNQWNILQCFVAGYISPRIRSKPIDLISLLVKSERFDVRVLTPSSQNLLHLLCLRPFNRSQRHLDKNDKIAEILLENGVDSNQKDEGGKTPLMVAYQNGYMSVVSALVILEWVTLEIDAIDSSGESAFTIAGRRKDHKGLTGFISALFWQAVYAEKISMVTRFRNCSTEICARRLKDLCVRPIKRRFLIDSLRYELQIDPSIASGNSIALEDVEHPEGSYIGFYAWFFAIEVAVDRMHGAMVELLLRFDKLICGTTRNGFTALHLAMLHRQPTFTPFGLGIFEILIVSGKFDINALTNNQETVLHFACRCKDANHVQLIIELILMCKVNVNQRNYQGQTALMIACENENVAAVRELLEKKYVEGETIDINAKDNVGQTALSLAYQSNNAEIAAMIDQALLLNASENDDLETIENVIIEECFEIGDDDLESFTEEMKITCEVEQSIPDKEWNILQLIVAGYIPPRIKSEPIDLISTLVRSGRFDINSLTSSSQNLLHLRCLRPLNRGQRDLDQKDEIAKMLLLNGIDINQKDERGKTPLMVAYQNGHTPVIATLVGMAWIALEIDTLDSSGESAFTIAGRNKDHYVLTRFSLVLFLQAVSAGNMNTVTRFRNCSTEICAEGLKNLCVRPIKRKLLIDSLRFELQSDPPIAAGNAIAHPGMEHPAGSCLSFFGWFIAIAIADNRKHEAMVQLLICFEKLVCGTTKDGFTALHLAIMTYPQLSFKTFEFSLFEILIKSGRFDVNALTNNHETALHCACRCEDASQVELVIGLLLKCKVNVNQRNCLGQTALMIACENENVAAVCELLTWKDPDGVKLDIDLNAEDNFGQTALYLANQSHNEDTALITAMIESVLQQNAIENASIKECLNQSHNEDIAAMIEHALLINANENDDLETIENAFIEECFEIGDDDLLSFTEEMKITCEVEQSIPDNEWDTLQLIVAGYIPPRIKSKPIDLVSPLIESGRFDVNSLTSSSQNLLHLLCLRPLNTGQRDLDQKGEIAKLLIENGVDINQKDERGNTPLMIACENGHASVIATLVGTTWISLEIDCVDSSGESAFTIAGRKKYHDVLEQLILALFLQAVYAGNMNNVARFRNCSKEICSRRLEDLCVSPIKRRFQGDSLRLELQSDPPITAGDAIVNSDMELPAGSCLSFFAWFLAIVVADNRKHEAMVHLLLRFEKLVCGTTKDGFTALHLAIPYPQLQFKSFGCSIFEILIKSGRFDVNALTNNHETALHCACRCKDASQVELIIGLLLKCKVNVNQRNFLGQTALMIACENENVAAVCELLTWKDPYGVQLDINAEDNFGQTALYLANQSHNEDTALITAMIESVMLQNAIENDFAKECFEIGDDNQRSCAKDSEYESRQSKSYCLKNSSDFISSDEDEYENVRSRFNEMLYPSETFLESVNPEIFVDYFIKDLSFSDEQRAFLIAVVNGDTETVNTYFSTKGSNVEVLYHRVRITDHREHKSEQIKGLSEAPPPKGLKARFTSKDFITDSLWLEAVTIAHRKRHVDVLNLLFDDDRFYQELNDDGQNILHQAMKDYLAVEYYSQKAEIIDILLKPHKSRANVLNLQNETILEIVCKVKPPSTRTLNMQTHPLQNKTKRMNLKLQIYRLLRIIRYNGIDLNDRNKTGKTLLMLACENERTDIVRSLLKLTLDGFHLDIDAVDNLGETALMKAKRKNDLQIAAALLRFKFISAVEDENLDVVKCMLDEFQNTSDIVVTSWNSETYRDEIGEEDENKFGNWRDAMYIAVEKGTKLSEEILKLLLDCGILSHLESELGYPILHRLIRHRPKVEDKLLRLMEMQVKSEKYANAAGEEWKAAMRLAEEESEASLHIHHDADEKEKGWTAQIHADKTMRLIEMLLKSGKINVNATDEDGETALHLIEDRNLTSLFIRYGADVNKKDKSGATPLTMASMIGYEVSVLETILEESKKAGNFVDLDAIDCNGRTALMIAVMKSRLDVVELLLNAGASVILSDHLGFTALHHALFGDISERDEFPRNSEELRKRKEIAFLFDAAKSYERIRGFGRNENRNERIMAIVQMLLRRSDVDVNALSFERFSPLDIAEGCIPLIPPFIKDALKEKGAVLGVFQETESQSKSNFYLDVRCKTTLHRFVKGIFFDAEGDFRRERLLNLIESFKKQIISGKDKQGRTALHFVVFFFSTVYAELLNSNELLPGRKMANAFVELANSRGYNANITDFCKRKPLHYVENILPERQCTMAVKAFNGHRRLLAKTILKKLISLGCSVNETDVYGRTPLHYANNSLKDLLEYYGADASIKDKDGRTAFDYASRSSDDRRTPVDVSDIVKALYNRNEENLVLCLMKYRRMEINVQYSHAQDRTSEEKRAKMSPKLLWTDGKYAFCHSLVKHITKEVTDFMNMIAKEIENMDPRFEVRVVPVGSSNEGTKIDDPDEFDFCFVLTKISELCEVSHSPELPPGFVRLKQKLTKIGITKTYDFDGLFREDGILNTDKLNWQFVTTLNNAVVNIESQQKIEWHLEFAESGIDTMFTQRSTADMCYQLNRASNIKMIKTLNYTSVNMISIDIVACIHIDDWWPAEAISNVNEDIKSIGCNLVFHSPQSSHGWVPYSECCARISFAKAESDTIKQNCDNAREAYMIGKTMVEKSSSSSRYTLKNCMLYCIEALAPTSEKASKLRLSLEEMKSRFHQMDRYLWLKCLMKCHLEFVAQDFCPCYFLPTCTSPSGKQYLKQSSVKWMTDDDYEFPDLCKKAYAFYRCTSEDISESSCQLPAPNPLWEHFDRNQLIASLCEIAYK